MTINHKNSQLGLAILLCSFCFSAAWGSQTWKNQNIAENRKVETKSPFLSPHRPSVKPENEPLRTEAQELPPPSSSSNASTDTPKKRGRLQSFRNRLSPPKKTGVGELNHNQKALQKRAALQLSTLSNLVTLKRTTLIKLAHIHELKILCQNDNPGKSEQSCTSIAEIMARQKGNRNSAAMTQVRKSCKTDTPPMLDSCFKDAFSNSKHTFRLMNRKWPDSCDQRAYEEAKIQTGSPNDAFEVKLEKLKTIEFCLSSIKSSIPSKK